MTEEKEDKTYYLEERLSDFAVRIIRMAESMHKTKVANHNDRISGSNQPYGLLFIRSQSEAIPPFDIRYSIFDILRFAFTRLCSKFDRNGYQRSFI